jgi:hypothetical protein
VSKRRRPKCDHAKVVQGRAWRAEMGDEFETVPALVRKRVLLKHPGLDLADEAKASDIQVYELLEHLLHYEPIRREHLEELIDRRVPQVFGLR